MAATQRQTGFHRLAVSTVPVAMLTVMFGALTTSKNAGMAFRDWPTSDGQFMVTYPWFADFATNWDKFLEHGHRLAGMLIGIWSIALVVGAFWTNQKRSLKVLSVVVLMGVIFQGLLGGWRVLRDLRVVAMYHGAFAAVVISIIGAVVLLSSRGWERAEGETDRGTMVLTKVLALLTVALLAVQFLYGGQIRHHGSGLHEHLGLGIASLALIFVNFTCCLNSNVGWIRRSGFLLLLIGLGQVLLGAGAWIMRFGFTPTGFVATSDSIQQVALRTMHTVWGIVTFKAAVVHLLKVLRVDTLSEFVEEPVRLRKSVSPLVTEGGQE